MQLQSHLSGLPSNTKMHDICDSSTWSKASSNARFFKGDKRGISLAFCTGGVNPFNHLIQCGQ